MKTLWLSIVILLSALFARAQDGRWIMNTNLNLEAQDNGLTYFWNYYDGADIPEGGWFGWMSYDGSVCTNIPAVINTGITNPAGTYYVFLKTLEYWPGTNWFITCGDGNGTSGIPTIYDWNKRWGSAAKVVTTTSFTNILLSATKSNPTNLEHVALEGLYYTTNQYEDFINEGEDKILVYRLSGETNTSPDIAGNWFEDSSFENWPSHGWGFKCYFTSPAGTNSGAYHMDYPLGALADRSTSYHGKTSLHVTQGGALYSRIFKLRADRNYTLSLAMRRTNSTSHVTVTLYPIPTVPADKTPNTNIVMVLAAAAESSTDWVRYSTNIILWKYPGEYFQFRIDCGRGDHQEIPTDVFLDAVQIEEGPLTAFAPRYASEFGLHTTNMVNVSTNGAPSIEITGFHNGAGSSVALNYEVFDINNFRISGSTTITCGASNVFTNTLSLSAVTNNGSYRLVAWVDGAPDYRDEIIIGVLPGPPTLSTNYSLGVHGHFLSYHSRMYKHLGIKFNRSLSPGTMFRWNLNEPTEGNFVWNDMIIDAVVTNDITILASVGLNVDWPSFANDGSLFLLPKYSNWVYQTVLHHKAQIKYWEFWNEPEFVFTPTWMALMHSNFVYAVKAADSDAIIVGIGGDYNTVTATNTWNQLSSDVTDKIDFISYHIYPFAYSGEIMDVNENFKYWAKGFAFAGKEMWNTETGAKDNHYGFTEVYGFDPQGEYYNQYNQGARYALPKLRTEMVLINFLRTVGSGGTKYFYYDHRIVADPSYQQTEFTAWEFNDAIRPKLIALVLANQLLGEFRGQGDITNQSNTFIEPYIGTNTAGKSIAFMWSRDNTNRFITLTNTSCVQYDAMCNPVTFTNSKVYLSRMPTYLLSDVNINVLSNTLKYAAVTNVADAMAPFVSIDKSVNGTITTNNFPLCFKWTGIDDTYTDTATYSYKLVGRDADFGSYTPDIYMEVPTLTDGVYHLEVKSKDILGNESAAMSGPEFTFGAVTEGVTNSTRQTSRRGLFLR